MVKGRLEKRFQHSLEFSNIGCIPEAIKKSNLTLAQILEDIKKEKKIENEVMRLHAIGIKPNKIGHALNISLSKTKHIISFDRLGLTYRKVGKK